MKIRLLIPTLLVSGCASVDIDHKTDLLAKTQCPIGYHLEQSNNLKFVSKDPSKKSVSTISFKCVIDSALDRHKNTIVDQ